MPNTASVASFRRDGSDPRGSASQLLTIIRSLPDVIFQCEKRADGKIYWTLNEGRLAEEFHLTTDVIRDKPLETLFPPETAARLIAEFERAFKGEGHEFTNELGGRFFKHYPQPVFGPDGKVVAVVGFISEVTSLVKAEREIESLNQKLRDRLNELAVANEELESFSYSVSHDLRTPLTGIDNHVQMLQKTESGAITKKGRESLDRVRASVKRMDDLIGDILRLSRSATEAINREPTDLVALARTVAIEIQELDPGRKVEWLFKGEGTAHADRRLLRSVLQNLLGNAWKYSAQQKRPRIEFGAMTTAMGPSFYVRDNGIGFNPTDADKLFRAFSRLETPGTFEGTGVGLATVKRIVGRHGGRVWAEASPGHGATFYFTLP